MPRTTDIQLRNPLNEEQLSQITTLIQEVCGETQTRKRSPQDNEHSGLSDSKVPDQPPFHAAKQIAKASSPRVANEIQAWMTWVQTNWKIELPQRWNGRLTQGESIGFPHPDRKLNYHVNIEVEYDPMILLDRVPDRLGKDFWLEGLYEQLGWLPKQAVCVDWGARFIRASSDYLDKYGEAIAYVGLRIAELLDGLIEVDIHPKESENPSKRLPIEELRAFAKQLPGKSYEVTLDRGNGQLIQYIGLADPECFRAWLRYHYG